MHQVLLSLGANLGSPLTTLNRAIERISSDVLTDVRVSPFYETAPVGFQDQPPFVNAAMTGFTSASAVEIHHACKVIEKDLGRQHREQWHEREIDIDVILVGTEVHDDSHVHIPHPRMHERMFVLVPACDIAPNMLCPRSHKTLTQLLAECTDVVSQPKRLETNELDIFTAAAGIQ